METGAEGSSDAPARREDKGSTGALAATAYDLFKRSLQNLFDSLDHDGNGFISQREFVDATRLSMESRTTSSSQVSASDGRPVVNQELKEWCTRCGFDLDSVCFEDLDRNGDGEIRLALICKYFLDGNVVVCVQSLS